MYLLVCFWFEWMLVSPAELLTWISVLFSLCPMDRYLWDSVLFVQAVATHYRWNIFARFRFVHHVAFCCGPQLTLSSCPRRFPTEWVCLYFCTNHCTTNLRTPSFCFRVQVPLSFPTWLQCSILLISELMSPGGAGVRVDSNSPGGWNNFDQIFAKFGQVCQYHQQQHNTKIHQSPRR